MFSNRLMITEVIEAEDEHARKEIAEMMAEYYGSASTKSEVSMEDALLSALPPFLVRPSSLKRWMNFYEQQITILPFEMRRLKSK